MTTSTRTAIRALIDADGTLTPAERESIEAALNGGAGKKPMPELLTRRQVADMIKKTPAMVDNYARAGFLRRVRLGNSSRASGFDADSVRHFLGVA